jgi:hypothetical protein
MIRACKNNVEFLEFFHEQFQQDRGVVEATMVGSDEALK